MVFVCRMRTASESSLRRTHADQISVSSSGSSNSDMEDLSAPQPLKLKFRVSNNKNPTVFKLAWTFLTRVLLPPQSLSGSLHNVGEDFCSVPSPCPRLSSTTCSSSQPDLCSSLVPKLCPSSEQPSSNCCPQASLPVYNKQVDDSCIIRVSVECVSNGNVYKSILVRMAVSCFISELVSLIYRSCFKSLTKCQW